MSVIKKQKMKLESGRRFEVSVESYSSAQELVQDCQTRNRHDYDDMRERKMKEHWEGVNSYDEALELLRVGYQPTVDKLSTALKVNRKGIQKRIKFENNVHGFAPVVPLAMKGIPNSMIDMQMKPIKCKVVDVYYDMGINSEVSSDEIIECGQKLLGAVIDMEKQGYRFNLYALQGFSGDSDADILCVKVKSSDKPIDLKRISFPLTHPAFFRVIGFDWQGKSPAAKFRGWGRGCAMGYELETDEANEVIRNVFGDNSIYFSCHKIRYDNIEHIKEVLVNERKNR